MVITAVILLIGLLALLKGLRSGFYLLHAALVLMGTWALDPQGAFTPRFSKDAIAAVLALHLLIVNIVVFIAYAWDKRAAIHRQRRVREKTLHALAFIGGTPGAWIASRALRHKTVKQAFRHMFWLIVIVQVLLLMGALLWWKG